MHSYKAARLEEALKKPYDHDLPRMMRETRTQRQESPAQTCQWQPDSRWHALKDEVVRNLSQEVASVEYGIDLIELRSVKVQLFSHARDIGVV